MKSIINNDKKCYICDSIINVHKHHVFYGTANRKKSEQDGCWIYLCAKHHNMSDEGVHFNKILDNKLKKLVENVWCEYYQKNEDDFRKRYGKNYL